jgi:hypothetical protein
MPEAQEKKEGSSGNDDDKNLSKLTIKEILDKIGFGFGSQQFVNILFLQTGAPLFLIGLINALRVIFGNLISFFIEKFQNFKTNRKLIGLSGIIFGFSFLLIAVAIFLKSVMLFAFAIIIGSIFLVIYGESRTFFRISSNKAYLVEKVMKYSLIITAISLFTAAYLMDNYPASGTAVLLEVYNNLFSFKIYGYLIVFEIAAISFIAAGYILSKIRREPVTKVTSANLQLKDLSNLFIKNKIILLLIITSIIVSLVQTIGYSYYGIFIYQNFNNVLFGGFLNVAMVFLISVFTSLIGYFITKMNSKVYRGFPILIFGIMMIAFMPFAYFLKPNLIFITIGTIIGVIGGSAVGVTNSLLTIELISHNLRQAYFSFTNLVSIPFFLIMAPILTYIAQVYSLSVLFLSLTIILVVVIIMLLIALLMFKKELV